MRDAVEKLWPELQWIESPDLRESVTETWVRSMERSPLDPQDLNEIPFTLLVPNCQATFMEHKRCVVHIARRSAEAMQEFLGHALPIDKDTVIAGAILADVGKVLEYEKVDGEARQSARGRALRHPFTGVAVALECGVPDEVCHIIAAHAGEGDLVKRTTEATIVHHADFMSYLPFKNLAVDIRDLRLVQDNKLLRLQFQPGSHRALNRLIRALRKQVAVKELQVFRGIGGEAEDGTA